MSFTNVLPPVRVVSPGFGNGSQVLIHLSDQLWDTFCLNLKERMRGRCLCFNLWLYHYCLSCVTVNMNIEPCHFMELISLSSFVLSFSRTLQTITFSLQMIQTSEQHNSWSVSGNRSISSASVVVGRVLLFIIYNSSKP